MSSQQGPGDADVPARAATRQAAGTATGRVPGGPACAEQSGTGARARRRQQAAAGAAQGADRPATDRPAAAHPAAERGDGPEPPSAALALPQGWHRRGPTVAATLVALVALLDIGSAVTRSLHNRIAFLREYLPGGLPNAANAGVLLAGVLLLLLAKGLKRRKRRAWLGTELLLVGSVVLHLLKGLDVEEATISLALFVVLLVIRREFSAEGDPRTRWAAAYVFPALVVLDLAVGFAVLHLGRWKEPYGFMDQLRAIFWGMLTRPGPVHFVRPGVGDRVADSLAALGLVTAVTVVYLLLRPSEPVAQLAPADEERMRELLAKHGHRDSLGYFALRRDKGVVWSTTGKACIGYRVVSGVMLASGDPLGDPEAWPGAIQAFLAECARHAWTPAVMGCSEAGGTAWARAGLSTLELGDEAVVHVADFSLDGRSMRNVRQAVTRIRRAGYTTRVARIRDIAAAERAEFAAQAAAWRDTETERGFSMALGRFGDPHDGDCVAVAAFDSEGRLRGFLNFVPWGTDGLSLDLMRRDREADNGLNELLIVAALQGAPELGVRRVSLNFAVFRSALERGERLGAGPVLKAWRRLLIFASRWFQIESLYRFNAKFQPEWVPRYICYPTGADLPRIAVAALEAEAFLVWPRPSLRWLVGRRSSLQRSVA
ncbi:MAG TPA: phosphatidylglycerol lysyltransferase domain-containing protein [Frankiaceae bacterium]